MNKKRKQQVIEILSEMDINNGEWVTVDQDGEVRQWLEEPTTEGWASIWDAEPKPRPWGLIAPNFHTLGASLGFVAPFKGEGWRKYIFRKKEVDTPKPTPAKCTHIKTGDVYEVLHITNLHAEKDGWDITVVYRGSDGKVWSRPIIEFTNKFRRVEEGE